MNAALLVLAIAVGAPAAKDPPKKDDVTLVGEWSVENAIESGKQDNPPPGTTWTFTADGKSILKVGGMALGDSTYTADSKKTPSTVDVEAGPLGKKLVGIYKAEKDTLTLCIAEGDKERPKEFESPAGSKIVLITLKRIKKD
jgi:uncharacterized protein (TIGR03067 family)